jgi:hypothetical protein
MLEMNRIYTFHTHVPRSSISEYSETCSCSYYSHKDWSILSYLSTQLFDPVVIATVALEKNGKR